MLNRLPHQMPPLAVMLEDLGQPTTAQLGRALGVTERTARRWVAAGHAPRPAMLALFWVTRWGQSVVDADAHNQATTYAALARALRADNDALQADLARVLALADTGAANSASWRVLPMATVLPFRRAKLA
ncbi:hypothetical protein [Rubrivivax rivuli]|uniref:Uncharacterized protein n=1 Tax=Rubrivivax rivuli TaxID=1862385 RepID=A0A437RH91_9BURK|nr:hypothetical protein [Rubrivivax rivuli]RVU46109.1 hypothetical protein EOE66_09585 [Rubrivivax rivuli]